MSAPNPHSVRGAYYADEQVTLHQGDALTVLRALPSDSVDSVVTSPPYYGLRDYGVEGQWGAEATVGAYVERLVALFAEIRRVLVPTGAVWLNLGDTYAGKANASTAARGFDRDRPARQVAQLNRLADAPYKSLIGVPWRVALALSDDGWAIRNDLIWAKTNPMPHPVADRLNSAHEHVFLLTPSPRYHFDLDPVREAYRPDPRQDRADYVVTRERDRGGRTDGYTTPSPTWGDKGRNPGDWWPMATQPCPEAHFAVMPTELARRLVLTVCPPGGTVLDPFNGRGTTGRVARMHGRRYIGIDLNPTYLDLTVRGLEQGVLA